MLSDTEKKIESVWIDRIIEDLVDPDAKLKDIFLKVQVLAHKLENKKLEKWTKSELCGYKRDEVPDYRIVPATPMGEVMQDRGLGAFTIHNHFPLPLTFISDSTIISELSNIYMGNSIADMESIVAGKNKFVTSPIDHIMFPLLDRGLTNSHRVQKAWKRCSVASIEGILSSIKSNLLDFLLGLDKEFNDNKNYSIMKKKEKAEEIFEETIGTISAETVNLSFGDQSVQTVNTGDDVKLNVGQGKNVKQSLSVEVNEDIKNLVTLLNDGLDSLGLDDDSKQKVQHEIQVLKDQLSKKKPKRKVLSSALGTVKDILINVATNAATPAILDKIEKVLSVLS